MYCLVHSFELELNWGGGPSANVFKNWGGGGGPPRHGRSYIKAFKAIAYPVCFLDLYILVSVRAFQVSYYKYSQQYVEQYNCRCTLQSAQFVSLRSCTCSCKFELVLPLLTIYNSIFPKNTIDNQILKTQMDIAKMKFKDDILQENLIAVITYGKYSIFFKLL